MNQQQADTLMTYDQWYQLFKKHLQQTIKHILRRFIYGAAHFLILVLPPVLMIIHWIIVGY